MSKFTILTGAAIGKAINAFGKTVETFKAREHQLAYSALAHCDLHNDVKYLNALYQTTPANYRAGLSSWAVAFGNVTFDSKTLEFAYAKGKKSDLTAAMEVAPADYQKAKGNRDAKAFDEIAELEKVIARFADKGASMRTLNALKDALNVAKGAALAVVEPAKPARIVRKAKVAKPAPAAEVQQAA